MLQEVVDSARELTGAGWAVITTLDRRGAVQDIVTSGLTPENRRRMLEWPDGPRLFEHLGDLANPLRLTDVQHFFGSLGLSAFPWVVKTMQGTPMHHRGEHLGSFFLADKDSDEQFTAEDEEILVLFASQAATAIANARTHHEVERARADLEALIETSPVGVAVFDASTGRPVSFNREARRIVEGIRTPGHSAEQLLGVMTCRYADGREVSLEELPLARQFEDAATVRAEEIELSVPDGRSVRTLLNATPIRSRNGQVVSVVVTMQDLRALEELERQRAQFLGMVSHELRAPLTSIKGSAATVLGAMQVPAPAEMLQFFRIIEGQADHMHRLIANLLDAGSIEAGTLTVAPVASDVATLVDRARTTFLSGGAHNPVLIDLPQDLPRAMADGERIVQVLNNLLSNAARHSSPSSPIRVDGDVEDGYVALSVSDGGRGIPADELPCLFRKRAGRAGGTGLGLVICKGLVEAHGGRIRAESGGPGLGARFTFTIPAAGRAAGDPVPRVSSESAKRRGKTRILVVDDDPRTLRYVRDALSAAGYAPVVTGDADGLPGLIRSEKPHLVLLDLMLPGTDGIELMNRVPELSDLPVIFISGYGRDETVARALGSGAADYIVKPFSPTELVARVRAALRGRSGPDTFVLGELSVNYGKRRVTLAGRRVSLTATEFELLRVLSRDAGRVVTTRTVLRRVWGRNESSNNSRVRTAVKQLRAKLGDDAGDPVWIFTERGVGYRFASPGEA
ncbi:MAG: response regulator [Gemmatimonadetes bacterium]|nr:response regulator [Gemmatimonadota bacterium]MYE92085.1 response regulator [Gemmatimonadota bacterium]